MSEPHRVQIPISFDMCSQIVSNSVYRLRDPLLMSSVMEIQLHKLLAHFLSDMRPYMYYCWQRAYTRHQILEWYDDVHV